MKDHEETLQLTEHNTSAYAQTKSNPLFVNESSNTQAYAPFLMKSNRFGGQSATSFIPPIGSYNLPSCFDRKKSPFEDRVSHFLLQAVKKKQQMGIFKSSFNRFSKVSNSTPGPAAYNLFKPEDETKQKAIKVLTTKENLIEINKTCPSIPHKANKYGYAVDDGCMRSIQKNDEKLRSQKQSRKNYVSTLKGQQYFMQQTIHKNYHDADYRKKLYEETQKIVTKQQSIQQQQKYSTTYKKPKYEHLYHSKGVISPENYKYIGPGQYQIGSNTFSVGGKKQKYQFFGSTEVRFKHKDNMTEKGYTLIQMIRQNSKKSSADMLRDKKSPIKMRMNQSIVNETINRKNTQPGPGDYNPHDQISKKARGVAVFPLEQRFKQPAVDQYIEYVDDELTLSRDNSKKNAYGGNLKKERFKPMHKVYDPINSEQICGILSEKAEQEDKENKNNIKYGVRNKGKRDTHKSKAQNQEITCWSRGEDGEKVKARGYIKQLKEQLAIISHTPGHEESSKQLLKKKTYQYMNSNS